MPDTRLETPGRSRVPLDCQQVKGLAASPRVSIGMPVYNGMPLMRRAVASLLNQSFQDFELIVVDNASTDGSYDFARSLMSDPRVRLERNVRNIGLVGNFIRASELARGEFFMWAPADDYWEPQFVEQMVAKLEASPEAGVAMTAIRLIGDGGDTRGVIRFAGSDDPETMGPLRLSLSLVSPRKLNLFLMGLFRRPLLQQVTRLFPDVPGHERLVLMQLALHSKFAYVDETLHHRQIHALAYTQRHAEQPFQRRAAPGFTGDLRFMATLFVTLLQSNVVPLRRKVFIPLILLQFAATRVKRRLRSFLGNSIREWNARVLYALRRRQKILRRNAHNQYRHLGQTLRWRAKRTKSGLERSLKSTSRTLSSSLKKSRLKKSRRAFRSSIKPIRRALRHSLERLKRKVRSPRQTSRPPRPGLRTKRLWRRGRKVRLA